MDIILISGGNQKKIVERFFGNEKIGLHLFSNCKKALDYLYKEASSLIFLDFNVSCNEYEKSDFIRLVKRVRPVVKIIGMSNSRIHRKQCLRIGCDGFLCSGKKSFSKEELEKELEKIFLLK